VVEVYACRGAQTWWGARLAYPTRYTEGRTVQRSVLDRRIENSTQTEHRAMRFQIVLWSSD
jgi:hypothetical protein